jgi:polo-like kinase 1
MEAVGEEDEDDEEVLEDEQRKTYDAGVRQRELANQKARIVSQMTGRQRTGAHHIEQSSPRRSGPTTSTGGLYPAKRVTATSDLAARGYTAAPRVSLFDATRHNLDKGLEMGEDFTSPRQCSHDETRLQLTSRHRPIA